MPGPSATLRPPMSAPRPTATGTFARTPLPHLLVYALERRLDGTLVIEDGALRSAVRLLRGAPMKVKVPEDAHRLGELLVESGVVTAAAVERALAKGQATGRLTGVVLVGAGEASASDVQDALATQVLRRLGDLSAYSDNAVYGYYEGHDFLAALGSPKGAETIDPLAAVWHVTRVRPPVARIQATIERLRGQPLRLHRAARPARFGFTDSERALLDVLRVRAYDVAGLMATRLLPAEATAAVIHVLAITRHLDVGTGPPIGVDPSEVSPPSDADRPRTAPRRVTVPRPQATRPRAPVSATPTDAAPSEATELREEIGQRLAVIESQSYYDILGVDPKADAGSIRAAFFQLAKVWHPDRLPGALGDDREGAARIFARMTEAHQILSNDEQRREYDERLGAGEISDEEQAQVQRVLRAVTAFQKAGVHLRKGNLAEAEQEAKLAFEEDPEQAEYAALYADVISRHPGRTTFVEPLRLVNQARKRDENNLRIRLHRARVLQRAEQHRAAYLEYQHVAEHDERNVEAAREVRLYRMRKGKGVVDDEGASASGLNQDIGQLFGKWFKR
jgi:curved DNA-binding protein CbpA